MRKLIAATILFSAVAFGAEKLLGTMEVNDGGTVNNASTATIFNVPANSKISIQPPDGGAWVNADVTGCTNNSSSVCVLLGPSMLLPTSTGAAQTTAKTGGGNYTGGVVAMRCPNGTDKCLVNVYSRSGTE